MPDAEPPIRRATILVVDDAPQNLSLMSDLLEERYTVKLAPSGARALKIASSNALDLILLDIMMPEMDGYEVCQTLKANPATRDIPVMFLTAMDGMDDEEKGLLAGAVDYITKPISPPILLARVRNQLALKEAADKLREQFLVVEQEKVRARELLLKLKELADKLLEQNRQLKGEKERTHELLYKLGTNYLMQGQLDMAWDMFFQCPLGESVMPDFYKLALEFERKRQFAKAAMVYRAMVECNPGFCDIKQRLAQMQQAAHSETQPLAVVSQEATEDRDASAGQSEQFTLGRYRIERELGKGAMGTVYLGTDPMIGRVVAIKTVALDQDFGAREVTGIKENFFREAESAGRLAHPNIVAIYDVGEARDLAYIAMEFLKGHDLSRYTTPDNLLPLDKVLSIVERVAEGLAYAHNHGVVHRDIKPANIVYEPDTDSVKVTDFGIACITSAAAGKVGGGGSGSHGGVVAGTPSYMSPEQVGGKALDGRSDLYSLGVMLYVLVSGHLPFQCEQLEQLLGKIANEAHDDIRSHNPELPDCVATLVNTALAKNPEQRYQNGEQMAKALSVCRRSFMVFAH